MRSRFSNPRSTSLLSPTSATARTRLSTAIPRGTSGENRHSRAASACQASKASARPSGRNQRSVSPSAASPCRIQASAPVRQASAEAPPSQITPSS